MRVVVTGATGLIGAAVVARLIETGHAVTGVARRTAPAARRVPQASWVALDIAAATRPQDWRPVLAGAEAVVNCAGVFQDGPRDSTGGVHVAGAAALFAACQEARLRRVVHISAIGIDRAAPSAFSRSKAQGDRALRGHDFDWVILRPSVVLGPAAYGGSALFRGLAALPWLPVMPQSGGLQVVQLDEVVATVLHFLGAAAPARLTVDLAGPEILSVADIVRHYRRWLGWREPRLLPVPAAAAALVYRLGDAAGRLGWRSPLRSTARRELARGATGDPGRWTALTGIAPRSLAAALTARPAAALTARPAAAQERWFAALYLLKPAVFAVLALFWVVTGAVALGPGFAAGEGLLRAAGAGGLSGAAAVAGAAADIAIGVAIACRRTSRGALWAAIALSLLYLLAATATLPGLWLAPLGPLVKIVPILLLHLVALAILADR